MPKNVNMISRTHVKGTGRATHALVTPEQREQRKAGPWGSLASQSGLRSKRSCINNQKGRLGVGEVGLQLSVLATLAGDPGLVSNTHVSACNYLQLQFQEI